jgi:hypothetical protein
MDIFYFLAAFLLIRRLARATKFTDIYLKWKTLLSTARWVGC